jgi:hypothetical protein
MPNEKQLPRYKFSPHTSEAHKRAVKFYSLKLLELGVPVTTAVMNVVDNVFKSTWAKAVAQHK